jgi:apolipoprotein N-acyltransferase
MLAKLRGWRADLAAFGFGAASAAALPPLHVIPVLLLSIPALLALISAAPTWRAAARRGWWFGLGHHVLGLYWITEAILFEAARYWWLVPIAVPMIAGVLAVFVAIPAGIARLAMPGWRRAATLAGVWVLSDMARQFVLTGFPWNLWGTVWAVPGPVGDLFLQPASLIGAQGLSLLTLLLACSPALSWRFRWAGMAMLAVWAGYGAIRLSQSEPLRAGVTAIVVQGNVAQGQKWDRELALSIFRRYLDLTAAALGQAGSGAKVVIWPETAVPFLLDQDEGVRSAIAAVVGGTPALVGSVRFGEDRRPRNTLFAMLGGGIVAARYDKWHLVPFGEYQPDWLPLPIQVVPGGGFAKGAGPQTLHVAGLPPVGAMICYEAIFGSEIVDPADRPKWLVNITNDAWFGNSAGPRQHLAAARLRAVEEGLPLMRAANTGISAGYDAWGRELGRIGLNQTGTLTMALPGALPPTLFAQLGLWVPGLLALILPVLSLSRRYRKAKGRPEAEGKPQF